jgi:hypothetical protein
VAGDQAHDLGIGLGAHHRHGHAGHRHGAELRRLELPPIGVHDLRPKSGSHKMSEGERQAHLFGQVGPVTARPEDPHLGGTRAGRHGPDTGEAMAGAQCVVREGSVCREGRLSVS